MKYSNETLKDLIKDEVERSCKGILEATNKDNMLYQYWGISYLINFFKFNVFEFDDYKNMEELEKQVNNAFHKYYENAKAVFENAHKRLF